MKYHNLRKRINKLDNTHGKVLYIARSEAERLVLNKLAGPDDMIITIIL